MLIQERIEKDGATYHQVAVTLPEDYKFFAHPYSPLFEGFLYFKKEEVASIKTKSLEEVIEIALKHQLLA